MKWCRDYQFTEALNRIWFSSDVRARAIAAVQRGFEARSMLCVCTNQNRFRWRNNINPILKVSLLNLFPFFFSRVSISRSRFRVLPHSLSLLLVQRTSLFSCGISVVVVLFLSGIFFIYRSSSRYGCCQDAPLSEMPCADYAVCCECLFYGFFFQIYFCCCCHLCLFILPCITS